MFNLDYDLIVVAASNERSKRERNPSRRSLALQWRKGYKDDDKVKVRLRLRLTSLMIK